MKNKSVRLAITLSLWAPFASASPSPTILLGTEAEVRAACQRLPDVGVTCIDAGAPIDPAALGAGSVPMSQADYFLLDRTDRPPVKGFLVLTQLSTGAGNAYFSAVPAVFKTGFAGVGMTSTDLYDRQFWAAVGTALRFNLPDSDVTGRFLSEMDAQIAKARAEQLARDRAARATAARAASEAAYRASPQYANDMAKRAVEGCRSDIVRARAEIAQDERIAKISGYENALLREQAASIIVHCEDTIARNGH